MFFFIVGEVYVKWMFQYIYGYVQVGSGFFDVFYEVWNGQCVFVVCFVLCVYGCFQEFYGGNVWDFDWVLECQEYISSGLFVWFYVQYVFVVEEDFVFGDFVVVFVGKYIGQC